MMRRWLIVITLIFSSMSVSVQAQDSDTVTDTLEQSLVAVEQYVETLRGLEAQEEIAVAFPTRETVQAFLADQFALAYTDEVVAQELAFYQAFGLLPTDYALVDELTALFGQQVAGYYDTETQTMNVILSSGEQPTPDTRLPFLDRVIYAHEYVHALQDQYFDLEAFYAPVIDGTNADALLARQALVEGDATLVMATYTQAATEANPVGTLLDLGLGLLDLGDVSIPPGTPRVLEQELTFPYLNGQAFVQALYADGGWERVNAAFTDNPPLSTEHILHPETYLAGEMPIEVTLADESASLAGDWSLVRTGVMGEFYLREWLETRQSIESDLIAASADGWGGDAYHVYQSADGALAWELAIVWDDADEAREFYGGALLAYGNAIGGFTPLGIYESSSTFCWLPETVTLCVEYDGATMTLTQAPTRDAALALLNGE